MSEESTWHSKLLYLKIQAIEFYSFKCPALDWLMGSSNNTTHIWERVASCVIYFNNELYNRQSNFSICKEMNLS